MIKVITYGTYDLLHYGHIRLLERAKALGDYLIVGVTADGFDMARGKINVQQSLMERIEAVKATGLADEIVVEEYEGQKIDDIRRLGVDIFTVGSDWVGHFDYLNEYCKVVYLERTQGVSSSEIRAEKRELRVGLVGETSLINKFVRESYYVNGITISGVCTVDDSDFSDEVKKLPFITSSLDDLMAVSDALYSDIDINGHFNSVRYIEHVLDLFPLEKFKEKRVRRFEIAYMAECLCGDELAIYKDETSPGLFEIEIRKTANGEIACRGKIVVEAI